MTQLTFSDIPANQRPIFSDLAPHIVDSFVTYHRENPHVYEMFKAYAEQIRNSGTNIFGSKAIMEQIRWHYAVERRDHEFKVNNNFASCYARLLILNEPKFAEFFELRGHMAA